MAKKPSGRRRADVKVSILDQFELRSRRSVQEKQSAKSRRAEAKAAKQALAAARLQAQEIKPSIDTPASGNSIVRPAPKQNVLKRKVINFSTMAVSAGLVTSFTLPSYAFSPAIAAQAGITTATVSDLIEGEDTQEFTVGAIAKAKYVAGEAKYKTGSASAVVYRETINEYRKWNGPTAEEWIANPKYPKMTPELIMKVAAQYVGTPYVFGGENPRGFDCSGYVKYVFAQFGIPMHHSVSGQDYMVQMGLAVRVKPENARPGDIVIFDNLSHDGIYAGNGQFYHAPRRGDHVKLANIFVENYHFIRVLNR
ncbi:MAG: hypothetical protein RIT51_832 [Actinomycetota bacterium]